MFIFYFGDILLSILETLNVIKGTDGTHSSDGLAWPAAAVKNGLEVILICAVMTVTMIFMHKFFGPQDAVTKHVEEDTPRMTGWMAIFDGYLSYLPEFFYQLLCCGVDSYRLAKKRVELRARRKREMYATEGNASTHALSPVLDPNNKENNV